MFQNATIPVQYRSSPDLSHTTFSLHYRIDRQYRRSSHLHHGISDKTSNSAPLQKHHTGPRPGDVLGASDKIPFYFQRQRTPLTVRPRGLRAIVTPPVAALAIKLGCYAPSRLRLSDLPSLTRPLSLPTGNCLVSRRKH